MVDCCVACNSYTACFSFYHVFTDKSGPKTDRWYVPHEIESRHGVSAWEIRDSPSSVARVIQLLRPGEEFIVAARQGDWLKVTLAPGRTGWVDVKLRTSSREALQIVTPSPESFLETADDRVATSAPEARHSQERVDELARQKSYAHADFTNPRAESCWLSTFFQSLWHSRVFHTIFEARISGLAHAPRSTALGALQETWLLYKEAGTKTVPARALVEAMGTGLGDCSEAMGKIQVGPLEDVVGLVVVPWSGRTSSKQDLCNLISEMGVADHAIVAVDFVFPELKNTSMARLARSLKPEERSGLGDSNFQLVAMICYMEDFRHYVVFCKSLSERGTWIFFNDLPTLKPAPQTRRRFDDWDSVAQACGDYGCCPKMLLYENPVAGKAFLQKHGLSSDTHFTVEQTGHGCRLM